MPEFILHHRHRPEDCGEAFHDLETGSGLPEGVMFFCTCCGDDHGGYFQVEAATARDALELLPESMRATTKVTLGETLAIVGAEKAGDLPGVRLEPAGSGLMDRYMEALRSEVVVRQAAQEEVEELLARIHAVLGRAKESQAEPSESSIEHGPLRVDLAERRVTMRDHEVSLTPVEYSVLKLLVLNKGKVLTHETLLRSIWGPEYSNEREYLRVFISRLRHKIEADPAHPKHIVTVSRVGYRLEA